MERLQYVQEKIVKLPDSLRDEIEYGVVVNTLKKLFENIPESEKSRLTFDLVCWVCSICEIFFYKRNMGNIKRRVCIDALQDFANEETIDTFIGVAFETDKVIEKTWWRVLTLRFKKHFEQIQLKI